MSVDAVTASWLRSQYSVAGTTYDPLAAAWGDLAVASEINSPIASKADAVAEAARQHDFLLAPMVIETIELPGLRIDLVGKRITFYADDGSAGALAFVLGAEELPGLHRTQLTVLRRLT